MPVIKVFLNSDGASDTLPGFNNIVGDGAIGSGLLAADLLDDQGNPTGISLAEGAAPCTGFLAGAANADDTPDARFPTYFFRVFWYGSDAGEKFVLAGFGPGAEYTLEISGHNRNSRSTRYAATNSTPADEVYQVYSDPGTSPFIPEQPIVFTGTANASGEISISAELASSVWSACNGFILTYEELPVPTVEIANDLQPGASFTLNYSHYDAVPVSPVTITDSNNNSVTVAVTINDTVDGDGKHVGTATGTMPALPSSGTATGLLFGAVTIELGTA